MHNQNGGPAIVPPSTTISAGSTGEGWSGLLFNNLQRVNPLVNTGSNYMVPFNKVLVVTSSGYGIKSSSKVIMHFQNGGPAVVPAYTTISAGSTGEGWSGYLKDRYPSVPRHWRMVIAAQDASNWEAYVFEMQLKDESGNVVSGPGKGTAQTNTPGIADASNAFDDNESTKIVTEFGAGKLGKWISYTFNEPQWIHGIRVKGWSGNQNSIPSWRLEFSLDNGNSWTEAWTATGLGANWKEDSY